MTTTNISPSALAERNARQLAALDLMHGRPMDAGRHGARAGSAWADWYMAAYREMAPC
ncbi:MAG: hypothetical protein KKC18_08105 [Chloroflexi bacterium]|nr:hypothetical protein [Chloroflexota bacterium]